MRISISPLAGTDREAWEALWSGYQAFYRMQVPPHVCELTWQRFHDATEPMYALGAFVDGELRGIVHYIFHRSCSTTGPYCYLQDLFTDAEFRGRGIGRRLIEGVYAKAEEAGASRVYWLTHETNTIAMALYEKVAERTGFVQYRHLLK